MNNDIKLARIIAIKYVGTDMCADSSLMATIINVIEQIKDDCKDNAEIIHKSIDVLDSILGI